MFKVSIWFNTCLWRCWTSKRHAQPHNRAINVDFLFELFVDNSLIDCLVPLSISPYALAKSYWHISAFFFIKNFRFLKWVCALQKEKINISFLSVYCNRKFSCTLLWGCWIWYASGSVYSKKMYAELEIKIKILELDTWKNVD